MKITRKDEIVDKHPLPRKNDNRSKQTVVANMPRSDLYQALFPVYYLSKVSGLLPVRFTKLGPEKYSGQLSILDISYSMCLLLVLLCSECWGLWRDLQDGWEYSTRMKSKTAVVVTCSDVMAVAIFATVSIVGAPFRWNKMKLIMERLVEVDEKLGIISMHKTRRFCIIILSGTLIYSNLLAICDYMIWGMQMKKTNKMKDKGPINYVPLYLLYIPMLMMEIQIALAAYSLGQRFARLNKSLGTMLKTERLANFFPNELAAGDFSEHGQFRAVIRGDLRGEPLFRIRKILDVELIRNGSNNSGEMIYDLITVHSCLSDTVLLINNAFGVPALITVLSCLLHLIITPYFLILEANGEHHELFLAIQFMWCMGHIGRLLIIVQPCYAASVQAKETSVLVSQLLSVNWEKDVRKQLEIFSLQLLHRPLEFSACGLCTLDRSLVTSVAFLIFTMKSVLNSSLSFIQSFYFIFDCIIQNVTCVTLVAAIAGAVTTYLVILIQFQKDDENQDATSMIKNMSSILFKNSTTLGNLTILKGR